MCRTHAPAPKQASHLDVPGALRDGKLEVDIFAFNVRMRHNAADVPAQRGVGSSKSAIDSVQCYSNSFARVGVDDARRGKLPQCGIKGGGGWAERKAAVATFVP